MENVDSVPARFDMTKYKLYSGRVKCFDIEAGKFIAVLNEREAKENSIFTGDRVVLSAHGKEKVAIVDLSEEVVERGEIGLFADTSSELRVHEGDKVDVRLVGVPDSIKVIRKKMDGVPMNAPEIATIVHEMMENRLSETELAAWVAAMYMKGLNSDETVALTKEIVKSGDTLKLDRKPIVDKHCAGGVAGNRTTMVLVPIMAAAGLYIPKTSSRSITSASGTADTMEVLAPVEFSIEEMRRIVLKTHGCMVWGGAINLAAADDKLIKIRHSLSLDPRGVLLASILAKKVSVGARYVVIDIPAGMGTKFEDMGSARSLAKDFLNIGSRLGLEIECLITDGTDPVGQRIGPALECYDVLEALQKFTPHDLLDKSCQLAGALLEKCGKVQKGRGYTAALELVKNGKAYEKFKEIVGEQGGNPNVKVTDLPIGTHKYVVEAQASGRVRLVDNRDISRIARAAGAPHDKGAGIILHCEQGDKVSKGDLLFEIIAESESKLDFAVKLHEDINPVRLQSVVLGKVD
ncbi:MAG: AMP phosphorylase [Candidatus Burarchaeum sp.]|nr:AMP phosphorylase [Candidatus Burarchaeum sp.]MDO8339885.1 AMP phosphorylase [Candidatus Burarchaeum sp.]